MALPIQAETSRKILEMTTNALQVDAMRGKISETDSKLTREFGKAEGKVEQFSKDAAKTFQNDKNASSKQLSESIEKFDKTVEKKTADAKSGLSSWFGFGGK